MTPYIITFVTLCFMAAGVGFVLGNKHAAIVITALAGLTLILFLLRYAGHPSLVGRKP